MTVLTGPGEVHDVMAGRCGVLAALPAAATWIDMTSSSPEVGGYCSRPRMLTASACSRLQSAAESRRPGPGSCSYSRVAMPPWLIVTARCWRCWPTRSVTTGPCPATLAPSGSSSARISSANSASASCGGHVLEAALHQPGITDAHPAALSSRMSWRSLGLPVRYSARPGACSARRARRRQVDQRREGAQASSQANTRSWLSRYATCG